MRQACVKHAQHTAASERHTQYEKKMKDKSKMRMYIRGAHKQLVPDMALLNHSCATHTRTYTCRTIQRIIKIETSIHVHMLEFDPSTIAGGHIKRK